MAPPHAADFVDSIGNGDDDDHGHNNTHFQLVNNTCDRGDRMTTELR